MYKQVGESKVAVMIVLNEIRKFMKTFKMRFFLNKVLSALSNERDQYSFHCHNYNVLYLYKDCFHEHFVASSSTRPADSLKKMFLKRTTQTEQSCLIAGDFVVEQKNCIVRVKNKSVA